MIDALGSARGAHAAPAATADVNPFELTPDQAAAHLTATPGARLMAGGDRTIVTVAPQGARWTVTTLAHPQGIAFESPIAAVRYAVRAFGVDDFVAMPPSATPRPMPSFPTLPTQPRRDPLPATPGLPGGPPAAQLASFPLTAEDAAAQLAAGAPLIEGIGRDGRIHTLYVLDVRTSGGSRLVGGYRPSESSRANEIGGRTQWGDGVVREQAAYRVGTWYVRDGSGRSHDVRSSRDGLTELVAAGVVGFRVPPPLR